MRISFVCCVCLCLSVWRVFFLGGGRFFAFVDFPCVCLLCVLYVLNMCFMCDCVVVVSCVVLGGV